MTPFAARCRRCRGELALVELAGARDGRCPRCGRRLTEGWAGLLRTEAVRADIARRQLVRSLRRLAGIPGHLEIRPHPLAAEVVAAAGGDRQQGDAGGSAGGTGAWGGRRTLREMLRFSTRRALASRTTAALAPYEAAASATALRAGRRRRRRRP
ncbi:MAG TPA: hypothetical protein VIL48_05835 [Acidimicrobiales bacterium]